MINETIYQLRKERNITQDVLAQALGISVQAVSKWETGGSLPDILLLPDIAKFFEVTIDYLFYPKKNNTIKSVQTNFPDDDILRVGMFRGNHLLNLSEFKKGLSIPLTIEAERYRDTKIDITILGNATIEGDISGCVNAGGYLECGDVGGSANAGAYMECGDVNGDVNAGAYVECGDVGGGVNAGAYVECDDVGNSINAGSYIECDSVNGSVTSGGDIECDDITGDVRCSGDLTAGDISGNVKVEHGTVHCNSIH